MNLIDLELRDGSQWRMQRAKWDWGQRRQVLLLFIRGRIR